MGITSKVINKIKREINDNKQKKEILKQDKNNYDPSKIHFCDTGLWTSFKDTCFTQPFVKALITAAKNKGLPDLQYCHYKPEIEFFSVNCKRNAIDKSKAKVKIFYTGEDVNKNYTNFKDLHLDKADLSLGFDYPEDRNNAANYLRYPYWMLCFFGYTEDKDKIKEEVDRFNSIKNCRERFCSYVAFHDDDGLRKRIIDIVERVDHVSCGGASYHNDDSLVNEYKDVKADYISHFMFNICPENVSVKGYTTEKLFQSFSAGCIPVYYGSLGEPEVFVNKKAIVMYDGNNADEVEQKIRLLRDDEKYYNEFIKQPRLFDNAVDCIYEMNKNLRLKYEEIIKSKF